MNQETVHIEEGYLPTRDASPSVEVLNVDTENLQAARQSLLRRVEDLTSTVESHVSAQELLRNVLMDFLAPSLERMITERVEAIVGEKIDDVTNDLYAGREFERAVKDVVENMDFDAEVTNVEICIRPS